MRKVSRVGEKQFSYEDISGEQIITDHRAECENLAFTVVNVCGCHDIHQLIQAASYCT